VDWQKIILESGKKIEHQIIPQKNKFVTLMLIIMENKTNKKKFTKKYTPCTFLYTTIGILVINHAPNWALPFFLH
jgi:hypothetical protein